MGIMYKLMKHRNLTTDFNTKPNARNKSDKCRLLAMDGGHINQTDVKVNDDGDDDYSNDHRSTEGGDIEKRFTAEHILQLCKFLAEKSKRNKNLHKQQQSPKKLTKTHKTFQFQPMDYEEDNNADDSDNVDNMDDMVYDNDPDHDGDDDDNDDNTVARIYQSQALPLLSNSKSRHNKYLEDSQTIATTVLSSRLSSDINALNISSSSALQQQNQQQYQRLHQHHLQQEQLHQQPPPQHQQGKRDILLKIRHQIFERKRLREKGYEPQALNAAVASQVWRPW